MNVNMSLCVSVAACLLLTDSIPLSPLFTLSILSYRSKTYEKYSYAENYADQKKANGKVTNTEDIPSHYVFPVGVNGDKNSAKKKHPGLDLIWAESDGDYSINHYKTMQDKEVVVEDPVEPRGSCCDDGRFVFPDCGNWWYNCPFFGLHQAETWVQFNEPNQKYGSYAYPLMTEHKAKCKYSTTKQLCPVPTREQSCDDCQNVEECTGSVHLPSASEMKVMHKTREHPMDVTDMVAGCDAARRARNFENRMPGDEVVNVGYHTGKEKLYDVIFDQETSDDVNAANVASLDNTKIVRWNQVGRVPCNEYPNVEVISNPRSTEKVKPL